MTTIIRKTKKRTAPLTSLAALKSFKVPKKVPNESVLQSISLDSPDYLDEILPEIKQSFRYPHLFDCLQIVEAWLVHNKTLEQAFTASRKRLQRNPTTTDASYCTGFSVLTEWSKVESLANEGFSLGNCPDTWLGLPEQGVTLNQCADLAVARSQNRSQLKSHSPSAPHSYLIVARWAKSKAYLVAPEAEESDDRLEPQPGYACHVSTWSRRDLLDPAKISLERAFQMAQVYLYEFDEDLELCPKPGHVIPFAVVKCRWALNTQTANTRSEPLNPATGSILILPAGSLLSTIPVLHSSPRPALLPTPPAALLCPRNYKTAEEAAALMVTLDLSPPRVADSKSRPKPKKSLISSPPHIPPLMNDSKPTNDEKMSAPVHTVNPLVRSARLLHNTTDVLARLGQWVPVHPTGTDDVALNAPGSCLIGVSLLAWGHPTPVHSLPIEVHSYRKGKVAIFDGLLQPYLHIARLVSHASLHYELAGLTPRDSSKVEPNGPPVLVSLPREQEWCVPRLNASTASSLQCDPSPFAGYRGNYFRLSLHDTRAGRTELSLLCQTLCDKSLAGVIHMNCDESSVLIVFPDCPFSRSISFPPADSLDTNYLHAILLTPHSLDQYPYADISCSKLYRSNPIEAKGTKASFLPAAAVPVPTDLMFGQRKNAPTLQLDNRLKIPLDALLSSLPDGGKDMLGTALITLLASKRGNEDSTEGDGFPGRSSTNAHQPLCGLSSGPRLDPRLSRNRPMDTNSLASALLSTVARNPDLFKISTPPISESITTEEPVKSPDSPATEEVPPSCPLSPQAPLSPASESVPEFASVEPKEIPLSSSSPTKTMDGEDMEIESLEPPAHKDILQTSDMEASSSGDCEESPLKFYYPRRSVYTPHSSRPRESNSNFSFPTDVDRLLYDCRSIDYIHSTPAIQQSSYVHSNHDLIMNADTDTSTPCPFLMDRPTHHRTDFPGHHSHGQSHLPSSSPSPSPQLDKDERIRPVNVTAPSQKVTESGQPREEGYDKMLHGVHSSPVLILEDISKSHPYFNPSVDEGEEGEVTDDDGEDDVSETDVDRKRGRILYHPDPDRPFPCISSDISGGGLNVVDEWHTSSQDSSYSRSYSPSPRSTPRKRSPKQHQQQPRYSPRHTRNVSDSRKPSYPSRPSADANNFSRNSKRSHRPNYSRALNHSHDEPEFSIIDHINSSFDNSDHSYQDTEPSLEDEDMRITRPIVQHSRLGLLPFPTEQQRHCYHILSQTNSDHPRPPDRKDEHPSYLGDQDMDYRHIGEHPTNPDNRHSSNDSRHISSSGSSSSDYLPKYSVYLPKTESVSRSSRSNSRSSPSDKYRVYNNRTTTMHRFSPARPTSYHLENRSGRRKPSPPSRGLNNDYLDPLTVSTHGTTTYRAGLPMIDPDASSFWCMNQRLTQVGAHHAHPPPWK